MALPRFFDRAVTAVGNHLTIDRETLETLLSDVDVVIRLDFAYPNAEVTGKLLVNLLARLYPRLVLQGNDSACDEAKALAQSINPDIEIVSNTEKDKVTVVVGANDVNADEIAASSAGWVASLGSSTISGPTNPLAAAFAGALAAGEVFKRIFDNHLVTGPAPKCDFRISLLDYSESSGINDSLCHAEVGNVAFVGLGAVGNSAIWSLSCLDRVKGEVWLVDDEEIELSNLQRYVLATDDDLLKVCHKTLIADRYLKKVGLSPNLRPLPLQTFANEFGGAFGIDTICISLDNFQDRRAAQALLPRLIVNGYTGKTDIGASWHRIGDNSKQCLACLYRGNPSKSRLEAMSESLGLPMKEVALLFPAEVFLSEDQIVRIETFHELTSGTLSAWIGKHLNDVYRDVICGQLSIKTSATRGEVVPLAHQSALAGILMATELVKRTSLDLEKASQPLEQVTWGNILGHPPKNWCQTSPATSGCICRDADYLDVYARRWNA